MAKPCVLFVLVCLFSFGLGAKIPSTFKICKRSDPDLNNCFARAIEHALPYLKEPIPELHLPSLYPAIIESVTVGPGPRGIVNTTQKLSDIAIYNLINSKINKAELTLGNEELKAVVHIYNPQVKSECDYDVQGTVLSVPIAGQGRGYITADEVQVTISFAGKLYTKKNKTYVKLNEVKVDMNPKKMTYKMENLFDGNRRLRDEMNKLVNDNWEKVFDDIKEPYELTLSVYFKSILSSVYDRVPCDDLFPL